MPYILPLRRTLPLEEMEKGRDCTSSDSYPIGPCHTLGTTLGAAVAGPGRLGDSAQHGILQLAPLGKRRSSPYYSYMLAVALRDSRVKGGKFQLQKGRQCLVCAEREVSPRVETPKARSGADHRIPQ